MIRKLGMERRKADKKTRKASREMNERQREASVTMKTLEERMMG